LGGEFVDRLSNYEFLRKDSVASYFLQLSLVSTIEELLERKK
jgi:hypothetical protein